VDLVVDVGGVSSRRHSSSGCCFGLGVFLSIIVLVQAWLSLGFTP
jgi:hypothetical protein